MYPQSPSPCSAEFTLCIASPSHLSISTAHKSLLKLSMMLCAVFVVPASSSLSPIISDAHAVALSLSDNSDYLPCSLLLLLSVLGVSYRILVWPGLMRF